MRKTLGLMATMTSLTLIAAAPASANNGGQKPTVETTTAAKPEKKICKPIETTGSHRIERLCLTAKDWKRVEAEAEKTF